MPRPTSIRIGGASNTTRWALESPLGSVNEEKMQPNGNYFAHQRGESSQSNGYHSRQNGSVSSGRVSAPGHRQQNGAVGGGHDDYGYHSPLDERASYQISVNTNVKRRNTDAVGQHMLYETAMMDSQNFEILEIGEVDALKKEHVRLNQKIDGVQRKLALESKLKDAAQNLQRLYSSGKGRPDTPQNQSPDNAKRNRGSLLGRSGRSDSGGIEHLSQAGNELAAAVKKVDEVQEKVKQLLERRQYVERKLLRHTAAVLAEQANQTIASAVPGMENGHRNMSNGDESAYSYNDFDGIRDILHGMPAGASNKVQQHKQQMEGLQERLEQLNSQLKTVITEASRTLGKQPASETPLDQSEDTATRVENRIVRLEDNIQTLEEQQHGIKTHYGRIQSSEYESRNAIEQQLASLSYQLHGVLMLASEDRSVPGLQQPPQATGHGYQNQMQYIEDSLMTMEQLLQQHSHSLQSARDASGDASRAIEDAENRAAQQIQEAQDRANEQLEDAQAEASQQLEDAQAKASQHANKANEYETTVTGLWEILQMESSAPPSPRPDMKPANADEPPLTPMTPMTPRSPMQESFSLQAFSARVQHLFDRAQSAKEQQDILRRQVQQQRELNGKSDAEKDRQFAELQTKHEDMSNEHHHIQQELANAIVAHEQAEGDANTSRSELMNVMNELEEMKKAIDARSVERDEVSRTLQTHQASTTAMRSQIEDLEQQVQDLTDEANAKTGSMDSEAAAKMRAEMDEMEGEVVRLTTELTMAKADLDVAYGSRAERAGAQAGKVTSLQDSNKSLLERNGNLQRELEGMTHEFQELTKESLVLEREREGLDSVIDGLRDRVEGLESQLGDERVRWLGVSSLGQGEAGVKSPREATSTMVLREQFKRMMREARAEGVKALRTEQEERRRLEAELRKLRQSSGPLRAGSVASGSVSRAATPTGP